MHLRAAMKFLFVTTSLAAILLSALNMQAQHTQPNFVVEKPAASPTPVPRATRITSITPRKGRVPNKQHIIESQWSELVLEIPYPVAVSEPRAKQLFERGRDYIR